MTDDLHHPLEIVLFQFVHRLYSPSTLLKIASTLPN
jgi:hypothetical protein